MPRQGGALPVATLRSSETLWMSSRYTAAGSCIQINGAWHLPRALRIGIDPGRIGHGQRLTKGAPSPGKLSIGVNRQQYVRGLATVGDEHRACHRFAFGAADVLIRSTRSHQCRMLFSPHDDGALRLVRNNPNR
jgi:hypothetical protein